MFFQGGRQGPLSSHVGSWDLGITDDPLVRVVVCLWLGMYSGSYTYMDDLLTLAAMSRWSHVEYPMSADMWGSTWPVIQTGLTATILYMVSGKASRLAFDIGHSMPQCISQHAVSRGTS